MTSGLVRATRRRSARHKLNKWIDQYIEASVHTWPVYCAGKNHLVDANGYAFCGFEAGPTIPLTQAALKERNERGLVCLKCAKAVVI